MSKNELCEKVIKQLSGKSGSMCFGVTVVKIHILITNIYPIKSFTIKNDYLPLSTLSCSLINAVNNSKENTKINAQNRYR